MGSGVFGWIPGGEFDIHYVLLLCASILVTAILASGLLGKRACPGMGEGEGEGACGWNLDGESDIHHVLLVCASNLVTASL